MGAPGLPVPQKSEPKEMERAIELYSDALATGVTHTELARKLAQGDKHKAKMIRQRIRRLALVPEFQRRLTEKVKTEGFLYSGAVMDSLVQRAQNTGRPDAVKLLFEVTGFHAPRVEHEHTGDVAITLNLPRPEARETQTLAEAEAIEGKGKPTDLGKDP